MKATQSRGRAFTLIELLIVMGIIGILVALLFPAVRTAREAAAKIDAANAVKSLETAIKNFEYEYGKLPLQTAPGADREYVSDYATLLNALRSTSTGYTYNPKRTIYFDLPDRKLDTAGRYLDPWDQPYRVFADMNGDNNVDTLGVYGTIKGRKVVVWSKGPDCSDTQPTNRLDDIISWGK